MTQARSQLISLSETPYYHCVSRCVRRAFLCGEQYEHRRDWVEEKLLSLTDIFCIDVAAYAVMHNHYHVVVHVDVEKAKSLDTLAVIKRWHQLYQGNLLSQQAVKGKPLGEAEWNTLLLIVETWRERLMSISWFMRNINEGIARQANKEDKCTGRFWEGRFKSQALLDERALAACMAYVDLNPIRAKMAKTPERSDFTSAKKRCTKAQHASNPNHKYQQPKQLMPFVGNIRENMPKGLPFPLTDYLQLLDWSGRAVRTDKRGAISNNLPPLLERLGIAGDNWHILMQHFESRCKSFVGSENILQRTCNKMGYQRTPGVKQAKVLFG